MWSGTVCASRAGSDTTRQEIVAMRTVKLWWSQNSHWWFQWESTRFLSDNTLSCLHHQLPNKSKQIFMFQKAKKNYAVCQLSWLVVVENKLLFWAIAFILRKRQLLTKAKQRKVKTHVHVEYFWYLCNSWLLAQPKFICAEHTVFQRFMLVNSSRIPGIFPD